VFRERFETGTSPIQVGAEANILDYLYNFTNISGSPGLDAWLQEGWLNGNAY
jgi:hypothetical protein